MSDERKDDLETISLAEYCPFIADVPVESYIKLLLVFVFAERSSEEII